MPFLRFHGVEQEKLTQVGEKLVSGIVDILGCPRETVVLEVMCSSFISGDDHLQTYPFVKVEYFERPRNQQDDVALFVYQCMNEVGYSDCDVYFSYLSKERYYENGKLVE